MAEQENLPSPGDAEQAQASVMGYFELLKGWQVPITLETDAGVEAEGLVDVVDPNRQRLTLAIRNAPPAGLDPNDAVKLYFGMEDLRWMGSAIVLHHRDNRRSFVMTLPKRFEPKDRRKGPRVRGLQGASVLLRPGEFQEEAYHGLVMDISDGGLQMRLERSSGVLSEAEGELREGQDLALVRVSGLRPKELEAQGRLVHMKRTPAGLLIGVRFRNLRGEERRILTDWLKPLMVEPPLVLPPLGRPALAPAGSEFLMAESAPPELRTDALLRLKKRGRTLLLAMPRGAKRDAAATFLAEAGYGRILTADLLAEVMEILSSNLPIHGVIIDDGVEEMRGLELASFVHHAKENERCPIFLAESAHRGNQEALARRAGVSRLLPKPYLNEAFLALLEEELDLRPKEVESESPAAAPTPLPSAKYLRRSRSVALVMPPGLERDRVADSLSREGFTRVLPAGTVGELVRALQSTTLGLAFVDWPDADVQGLEIAHFLAASLKEGKVAMIVTLSHASPSQIQDALALGVAHLLVKPYDLDAAFAESLGSYLEE